MTPQALAATLAAARISRRALPAFPDFPGLTEPLAYAVQEAQLARLPPMPGWKVGNTPPQVQRRTGIARFFGPAGYLVLAEAGAPAIAPIIAGGFAAAEPELVLQLGHVPPPESLGDPAALADAVAAVHLGAEIAGSPAPDIMAHGPLGAIADLGNCLGLVIGPRLDRAMLLGPAPDLPGAIAVAIGINIDIDIDIDIEIGGKHLATGNAAALPGGPLACLAALLAHLAARNIALPPGAWVSTGAIAGVHPIRGGDLVTISCDQGRFEVRASERMLQDQAGHPPGSGPARQRQPEPPPGG